MLRHLERTLADAIAESADAHRVLEHLRAEGYGLYLLLDRHGRLDTGGLSRIDPGTADDPRDAEAVVHEVWNRKTAALEPPETSSVPDESRGLDSGEPGFRIDQSDLRFLRSIGIDPTRQVRRARDRR